MSVAKSAGAAIPRHVLAPADAPFHIVPLASFLRLNTDFVHRHNFYEVLWVRRGTGVHHIDFVAYPIQDEQLVVIAPGQVYHLRSEEGRLEEAAILIFKEEFVVRDAADRDLLRDLAPWISPATPWQASVRDPAFAPLLALLEQEYARPTRDYEALRLVLQLVFRLVARQHQPAAGPATAPLASQRLGAFQALLEQEYRPWHQVAPYAAQLAVSSKRLDQLCRAALGKSAQRLVHERLALEAQRLLACQPDSIKEIAFALGFEDPSYFSRFFRAQTGVTPQVFRARFPDSTRR